MCSEVHMWFKGGCSGIGEGNLKWSCDNGLCFCRSEGAGASRHTIWEGSCDLFCSQEKDTIEKSDYWGSGKSERGPAEGKDSQSL